MRDLLLIRDPILDRGVLLMVSISLMLTLLGCGGSGDSSIALNGRLEDADEIAHHHQEMGNDSLGSPIADVRICALAQCSVTDSSGSWGISLDKSFKGGVVTISLQGAAISSALNITIPNGVDEVVVVLHRLEDGTIVAHDVSHSSGVSQSEIGVGELIEQDKHGQSLGHDH